MTATPYVGEIRAVRTFTIDPAGRLLPMAASTVPWHDGPNAAGCRHGHTPAAPGCGCGFWAYGSLRAAHGLLASRYVLAVVAGWGRVVPGTRGVRAQHARIEAVWVSRLVDDAVVERLRATYPSARFYRQRATMLAAHPLTTLPGYEPLSRLSRLRSWRRFAWRPEWWRHAAFLRAARTSSAHREN